MTRKEIKRLEIINRALDGSISVKDASVALGISERQVLRLKKKVRDDYIYDVTDRTVCWCENRN